MKYLILFIALFLSVAMLAAELPEKGLDPPAIIYGPGGRPDNPLPVGNGIIIVVGFGILYSLKKRILSKN